MKLSISTQTKNHSDVSDGAKQPRRRILFTVPNLEGGGAERAFITLLSHLSRDIFELHLALVKKQGKYLDDLPKDVRVHNLGGNPLLAFPRLLALMWKLKPDVVFSTLAFYSSLVLMLKWFAPRKTRFAVRECCLPSVHIPSMPRGRLKALLYPVAYRNADGVICESDAMVADVASCGINEGKLTVISNPLDTALVRAEGEGAVNPYGPGQHLVAIGRLIHLKGMDLLLTAFSYVAAAKGDVTLHILGVGPEDAALKQQSEDEGVAGRVVFHGFVDSPFGHMAHADLLVLPSRWEGYPNVVLEALALGTPVVAFELPGGSAVVDGKNGRTVPQGDTDALSEAILEMLDGPIPSSEQIRATVAEHDVGIVARQVERALLG